MDVSKLTAENILSAKSPGDIFTSPGSYKKEYRQLCRIWHTDINHDPSAYEVMTIINNLYDKAEKLVTSGEWESTGRVRIPATKPVDIMYISSFSFEFGDAYICKNSLIYHFKEQYIKFAERYKYVVEHFRFANDSMKDRMRYFYPSIYRTLKVNDGILVLVDKNIRLIRLRDLLEYYHGKVPHRHVAWIISSLLNLACFIEYNKLTHNGITLDSYFIDPTDHNGLLAGGWWFATNDSCSLLGVSREVYNVMPKRAKLDRIGCIETDLESIKLIGRELLGDKYGMDFKNRDPDIPESIISYLNSPVCKSALEEYKTWDAVLDNAYGERKFIEMTVRSDDIYNIV